MRLMRARAYGSNKYQERTYKVHVRKKFNQSTGDAITLCNQKPILYSLQEGTEQDVTCQHCLTKLARAKSL